jgi:hypothetical protein
MKTWTELEAELEPKLRKWAQDLDQMEAEEAAAQAAYDANIKAAVGDAKAKLQAEAAKMNADFETRRTKLEQDLAEADRKLDVAADNLAARVANAEGKAKADLEAQSARLTATREMVNAQIKANYEAQVKHIKGQIAEMQAWAKTTDEKIRTKVTLDLDAARKRVAEVEQHIQDLHAEDVAGWNEAKAKVERALAELKAGRDKANADLKEARERAKSEFKEKA